MLGQVPLARPMTLFGAADGIDPDARRRRTIQTTTELLTNYLRNHLELLALRHIAALNHAVAIDTLAQLENCLEREGERSLCLTGRDAFCSKRT